MPTRARRQHLILFHAQDGFCAGCGNKIRNRRGNLDDALAASFDHVLPRSEGGTQIVTSGLLKHRRCNEARGSQPATGCDRLWQIVVAARLKQAKKAGLAEFWSERNKVRREEQRLARVAAEDEGRIAEGHDGTRYRLWGFVRLAARQSDFIDPAITATMTEQTLRGRATRRYFTTMKQAVGYPITVSLSGIKAHPRRVDTYR